MSLNLSRKEKHKFLIDILSRIQIDENERELYILSLEILEENEFDTFYTKIYLQVTNNGKIHEEIEKRMIEPMSSNII